MEKLILFNKTTIGGASSGSATINLNQSNGCITIGNVCMRELDLSLASKIHFAQDPKSNSFLLLKADAEDTDAFELVKYKDDKNSKFSCKALVSRIAKELLRKDLEAIVYDVETVGKPMEGFMSYSLTPRPIRLKSK